MFNLRKPLWRNILTGLCSILPFASLGQQEVSVDKFTGTAYVSVPLYTVQAGGVSIPIALSYKAAGVKVNELGSYVGVNWSLTNAPSISRQVRGLPDDISITTAPERRYGWLTSPSNIKAELASVPLTQTNISCSGDPATVWQSISQFNYTGNNVHEMFDTEPDVFSYTLPGHNGKFVIDPSGLPRTIPFDPILIQVGTIGINGIPSFTIITPDGNVYYFDKKDETKKQAIKLVPAVKYFNNDYSYYSIPVTFTEAWHASTIRTYNGKTVNFSYAQYDGSSASFPILGKLLSDRYKGYSVPLMEYLWQVTIKKQQWLKKIETDYESIVYTLVDNANTAIPPGSGDEDCTYNSYYVASIEVVSKRNNPAYVTKRFDFKYDIVHTKYDPSYVWIDHSGYEIPEESIESISERRFLTGINIFNNCAVLPGYDFSYQSIGIDDNLMPPPDVCRQDYWGYYLFDVNMYDSRPKIYVYPGLRGNNNDFSPYRSFPIASQTLGTQLSGADRRPDPSKDILYSKIGALTNVKIPSGGSIALEYERHSFFDKTAAATFTGGGLRIKKIHYQDNITGLEQVREYGYTANDNMNAQSSGVLLHAPRFAFTVAEQSNENTLSKYWKDISVLSQTDLSSDPFESRSIGYKRVTEQVAGRGRTIYVYDTGVDSDDVSYTPNASGLSSWVRTKTWLAQASTNCAGTVTPYTPGVDAYPFPLSSNINFINGSLLQVEKQSELINNTRKIIQNTTYQYKFQQLQPLNTTMAALPAVKGFVYDQVSKAGSPIYAYGAYKLITDFMYTVTEERSTIYDQVNPANNTTLSTRYGYNDHGKLATVVKTNIIGNQQEVYSRTRYKYFDDYQLPANVALNANNTGEQLGILQQRFSGDNITQDVIETVQEKINPTSNQRIHIVGIQHKRFNRDGSGKTYLYQTYSWLPATTVAPSAYPDSIGLRSLSTNGPAVYDLAFSASKFQLKTVAEEVNANGLLPQTVLTMTGRQRASVHSSYLSSLPVLSISQARASEVIFSDFEADKDFAFQSAGTPTRSAARTGEYGILLTAVAPLTTALPNATTSSAYRLTFWARSATAATVNISVDPSVPSQAISIPDDDNWHMQEVTFDFANLNKPWSDYTLAITTSNNSIVAIDDITLLPATAMVASTTYNPALGKTSVTDAQGRTIYYGYDPAGRLTQVRDHNRAIVQQITAKVAGESTAPTVTFQVSGEMNEGNELAFDGYSPCLLGASYSWDFGDSYTQGTTQRTTATHTYSTAGSYTVTMRVHPLQGPEIVATRTISIVKAPLIANICLTGISSRDGCGVAPPNAFESCGSPISTWNGSNYYAVEVLNGSGLSYQWQASVPGIIVGNAFLSSVTISNPKVDYSIWCIVTSSDGRRVIASPKYFSIYYNSSSINSCPGMP